MLVRLGQAWFNIDMVRKAELLNHKGTIPAVRLTFGDGSQDIVTYESVAARNTELKDLRDAMQVYTPPP